MTIAKKKSLAEEQAEHISLSSPESAVLYFLNRDRPQPEMSVLPTQPYQTMDREKAKNILLGLKMLFDNKSFSG